MRPTGHGRSKETSLSWKPTRHSYHLRSFESGETIDPPKDRTSEDSPSSRQSWVVHCRCAIPGTRVLYLHGDIRESTHVRMSERLPSKGESRACRLLWEIWKKAEYTRRISRGCANAAIGQVCARNSHRERILLDDVRGQTGVPFVRRQYSLFANDLVTKSVTTTTNAVGMYAC